MGRLCVRLMRSSRWGVPPFPRDTIHVLAHSLNRLQEHQSCMHAQVGNKDVLNCYYAHAEDSLQVRAPLQLYTLSNPQTSDAVMSLQRHHVAMVRARLNSCLLKLTFLCRGGATGCWKAMTM